MLEIKKKRRFLFISSSESFPRSISRCDSCVRGMEIGRKSAENPGQRLCAIHTARSRQWEKRRRRRVEMWENEKIAFLTGYEKVHVERSCSKSPRIVLRTLRARGALSADEEIRQVLRPWRYLLTGVSHVAFRRGWSRRMKTRRDEKVRLFSQMQRVNMCACIFEIFSGDPIESPQIERMLARIECILRPGSSSECRNYTAELIHSPTRCR